MIEGLKQQESRIEALHKIELPNSVSPAIKFDPLPPGKIIPQGCRSARWCEHTSRPANIAASDEEIAFLPITELSELIRRRTDHVRASSPTSTSAPQEIRSRASLRHHAHREIARAHRRRRRRGDRARKISRPAARNSVGRKGPSRSEGLQDNVGRRSVQGAGHRRGRDRRSAARCGRRDARRQADARRARAGRHVVRRTHAQSMEGRSRDRADHPQVRLLRPRPDSSGSR